MPWIPIIKRFAEPALIIILATGLFLIPVSYFLGVKAQASEFPTYICGLAWLALCFFPGRVAQMRSNLLVVMSGVLIFYLAMTTAWSHSPSIKTTSLYLGFALLLMGFVAGILFAARTWPGFVSWFVTVTILSGVVSALYSLYFYYGLKFHPPISMNRLWGLGRLTNPAVSGYSYGVPLIFSTYLMFSRTGAAERWFWALAACVLGYAVFLGDTRSTWLGLVAAVIVSVVFSTRLSSTQRLIAGSATTVVIVAIIGGLLVSPWRGELLKRSTSFRPEIWSATLHNMKGPSWLIGHGDNVSSVIHGARYTFEHPHSIYLSTLFYGGFIGLTLLLLLIATSYAALLRERAGERRGLALASLTFGVVALLFDGDYLLDKIDFVWLAFWLPVALSSCLVSRRGRFL